MKKQPKVTPWFSGRTKPSRIGVYQRRNNHGNVFFYHFDGKDWLYGGSSLPGQAIAAYKPSPEQTLQWRGLTAKAAA